MTRFPDFFPVTRNNKWENTLVSGTYNRNGHATMENVAMEITNRNWGDILVIAMELHRVMKVLEWGKKSVCKREV